jgi:hypothetical protein
MKSFLFYFGNGSYDEQCAMVLANSLDEARELLVADLSALGHIKRLPISSADTTAGSPQPYYHSLQALTEAESRNAKGVEVDRNPIYIYGVDG